jgi:SAM-dependent methyltransferase
MSRPRPSGRKSLKLTAPNDAKNNGPTVPYDERYFAHYCDNREGRAAGLLAYGRNEHWLKFFGRIADRIVSDIKPQTVLDAGCAMGLLVEALRDRGVEAYGIDISEYAISQVREDVKPFCRVGSITDPLKETYDLIVSIEVLEHLPTEDAIEAIRNLCSATSDFVFSSTPVDYNELTHHNVQSPEWWAELFARQGLFRDVDYDPSTYISPQAVRYRRSLDTVARTVSRYEKLAWRLKTENLALRESALRQRAEMTRFEHIESELASIKASTGWKLANAPAAIAKKLFPYDTSRGRWLRAAFGRTPKPTHRPSV